MAVSYAVRHIANTAAATADHPAAEQVTKKATSTVTPDFVLLEARGCAIVVAFAGLLPAGFRAKLDAGVKYVLRGATGTGLSLAMTTLM
jgi:hypothetical protein